MKIIELRINNLNNKVEQHVTFVPMQATPKPLTQTEKAAQARKLKQASNTRRRDIARQLAATAKRTLAGPVQCGTVGGTPPVSNNIIQATPVSKTGVVSHGLQTARPIPMARVSKIVTLLTVQEIQLYLYHYMKQWGSFPQLNPPYMTLPKGRPMLYRVRGQS